LANPERSRPEEQSARQSSSVRVWLVVIASIVVFGLLAYTGWNNVKTTNEGVSPPVLPKASYPIGTPSPNYPSHLAPPNATAMLGYKLAYVDNFSSPGVPKGWYPFDGVPGGDPGGRFGPRHVFVKNGELILSSYRDESYNDRWVTGGMCQCGVSSLYGAYFVRSRVTGGGPNEVELLWPANNQWPPEIDFNESSSVHGTTSTVHWGQADYIQQVQETGVKMTSWHTWGVVWTPKEIVYVLDGRAWGVVTNPESIPRMTMNLDLEQRTECTIHRQCPKSPVQMEVDWIAEYHEN
jgi:Glycosyl hydrolases family 16